MMRSVHADARGRLDRFRRDRLRIPSVSIPARKGTVYFLTGDYDLPAGGIRVNYRHVDILNQAGISACVLHRSAGFRCTWFANQSRVTDTASVSVSPSDLLVVSELDVDLLARLPAGIAHVVFNQGVHLTWKRAADQISPQYRDNGDLRGIVTVSQYSADVLKYAFPGSAVHRVHLGIDPELFRIGTAERPRQIGYMPRRGKDDAALVLEILRARNALAGWDVVPLENLRHSAVGDALRQTRIFLSFAYQEGFGLPAAEAMACGAFVIGYDGFGGREHFQPEFSRPVEAGDVLAMAQAIEASIEQDRADPQWCMRRGRQASAFVHEAYSPEREEADVVALYSALLRGGQETPLADTEAMGS